MTTATETKRTETAGRGIEYGPGRESELRAAARKRGLMMKELAALMGVSVGYLSQVANGHRPWTPKMREKVMAALGEVPGQGMVYRQSGVAVTGQSSVIRERAREMGMTVRDLADRVGVSPGYMTGASRGHVNMGVKLQARVEEALQAPAQIAPASCDNRPASAVSSESCYIRERAREMGMTMKELADRVGVSYGYLSQAARGRVNMGFKLQARIEAALNAPVKIAPAVCANRPENIVAIGHSSYIRERARALGMSMRDLARRVGVSSGYLSQVSRGRKSMGVKLQARVEAALDGAAKVASAEWANVDPQVLWDRMNVHGISQNEVARRAGMSSAHLSNIVNGKASPSASVLRRLHGVLFRKAKSEERVMPAELKVLGWSKGERHGTVVHGARGRDGTARGGAVRIGGRVPWGAKAEYAYRAGYDGAVTAVHDPRPDAGLLRHAEAAGGGRRIAGHTHSSKRRGRCRNPDAAAVAASSSPPAPFGGQ